MQYEYVRVRIGENYKSMDSNMLTCHYEVA